MNRSTADYRNKRNFRLTPEPSGSSNLSSPAEGLRFVVQEHDATRLHYDFRLELDGSLKSWAVTKQPTGDVGPRCLAVQVEDHPLEYGDFEGEIPEGQYGAGSVVIWDSGTWIPEGDPQRGLRDGKLDFELVGSVLHGRWTLVRFGQRSLKTAKKDNWLLIKRHDTSTSRTMTGAVKRRMEQAVSPQLATLVSDVPTGGDWVFEPKLDGYRLLARVESGRIQLITRNGNDWTDRFPEIAHAVLDLPCTNAILDGEVVVFDSAGISHFPSLQKVLSTGRGTMHYVIFDLMHLDEWDLRSAPLSARKALLRQVLTGSRDPIRFGDHLEANGEQVFAHACKMHLEGIIAKKASAPYESGRTRAWLKLKCAHEQEFVIVGFTDPKGARSGFGALLLATRDSVRSPLRFVGRVGTGFDQETLRNVHRVLQTHERTDSPVPQLTKRLAGQDVHWVAPELVAQISFAGWTNDRHIRHAVFHGLREDKKARDVVAEHEERSPSSNPKPKNVRLTNPDKLLFSDPPVTKRDLADYWKKVAPLALPYMQDRPLTLLRCPDGIAQCFYQKHVGQMRPMESRQSRSNPEKNPMPPSGLSRVSSRWSSGEPSKYTPGERGKNTSIRRICSFSTSIPLKTCHGQPLSQRPRTCDHAWRRSAWFRSSN